MAFFGLFGDRKKKIDSNQRIVPNNNILHSQERLDENRTKYIKAFDKFQSCYNNYWAGSDKREYNITQIQSGIEFFIHTPDYRDNVSSYNEKYRSKIDFVLSHGNNLKIFMSLKNMADSLNNPRKVDLTRFNNNRRAIENMINAEVEMGKAMSHTLLFDGVFKKILDTRFTKDKEVAAIFALFIALTIAEKEYFESLCAARNKLA